MTSEATEDGRDPILRPQQLGFYIKLALFSKAACCHGTQSSKVSLERTVQCQVDLRKAGMRAGTHGGAEAVVLKSRAGDWKGMLGPPWK